MFGIYAYGKDGSRDTWYNPDVKNEKDSMNGSWACEYHDTDNIDMIYMRGYILQEDFTFKGKIYIEVSLKNWTCYFKIIEKNNWKYQIYNNTLIIEVPYEDDNRGSIYFATSAISKKMRLILKELQKERDKISSYES